MPYLSYDTFAKFAHPAVVEQLNDTGDFDIYEELISSVVYQITKIDIPDDPNTTPKWLVNNIVYLVQKSAMNKMQNISDDLRKQINLDYEDAIKALQAFKSAATTEYSVCKSMPGMINSSDNDKPLYE